MTARRRSKASVLDMAIEMASVNPTGIGLDEERSECWQRHCKVVQLAQTDAKLAKRLTKVCVESVGAQRHEHLRPPPPLAT